MPVPSSKHLSAAERDALSAMLEDPERVEIHGGNREWRAALLACVMSAACLTFGTASASSDCTVSNPRNAERSRSAATAASSGVECAGVVSVALETSSSIACSAVEWDLIP